MDHRLPPLPEAEPIPVHNHEVFAAVNMPNLGLEVEEFKAYTWRVRNWCRQKHKIRSPRFKCGGHYWRILLFPIGNVGQSVSTDFMSVYLEYDDRRASKGWHACAQLMLVVSNPKDSTINTAYHSHHRFDCKEPDWGFTRFKTLRSLTYLRDGQSRPTIEDGQADVSVFVRVMKDPTGKLWLDPEQADDNPKKDAEEEDEKTQSAKYYKKLRSLYLRCLRRVKV